MKQFLLNEKVPVYGWTEGVPVEAKAMEQLRNVAKMPFIHHHMAVMPDCHWGMGATVGSVIPTLGAIIPGSMGVKSFIVRGKGNLEAFNSCSHGAGRVMSRGQAMKEISLEQHAEDMAGVECKKDASVIDESPRAYKPIEAVMAAQDDLVEIVHTLKQVVCVKG